MMQDDARVFRPSFPLGKGVLKMEGKPLGGVNEVSIRPLNSPEKVELTGEVKIDFADDTTIDALIREQRNRIRDAMFGSLLGGAALNAPAEPNFVYCRYRLPSGKEMVTQVFCPKDDRKALKDILARRGMGETYDGPSYGFLPRPKMASEHLLAGDVHKAMHAAIWIGMVLNHCDPEAGRAAMMDDGAIHEMSHKVENHYTRSSLTGYARLLSDDQPSESDLRLVERLIEMEKKVPGLRPEWGLGEEDAKAFEREQRDRIEAIRDQRYRPKLGLHEGIIFRAPTGKAGRSLAIPKIQQGNHEDKIAGRRSDVVVIDDADDPFAALKDKIKALNVKDQPFYVPPLKPLPNQRSFEMSRLDDARTGKQKRIDAFMAKHAKKPSPEATASSPPKAGESFGDMVARFASPTGRVQIGFDPAAPRQSDASGRAALAAMGMAIAAGGISEMRYPKLIEADYAAVEQRLMAHAAAENILDETYGFVG